MHRTVHLQGEQMRRKHTRGKAPLGAALATAVLTLAPLQQAIARTPDRAGPPSRSADAAPRGIPPRVGVLTWNICGAINSCPNSSHPQRKLDELVDRVNDDASISVVMIQEACDSLHSTPLETALNQGTSGEWVVRHRTAKTIGTDNPVRCPRSGKPEAGVAIAMKKLPGSDLVHDSAGRPGWDMTFTSTSEPGGKHSQGAACLEDRGNKLLACTSHFANENADPDKALRTASARDFRNQARDWQNGGYRTIIGGDFNLEPGDDATQPLYDGNFEADSDEKCTTTGPWYLKGCRNVLGSKFDYVFFSDRGWDLERGRPLYVGSWRYDVGQLSDHWMLRAVVRPGD
ncbi:endonuclease/exonuclease/phosphatase family protein [Streptomyces sp. NA02950]|uniref:endonuclease/exonuclease/phosphatase family protein n=1 Tax=Streptomyces sp. NA02950 TaxID=2742137 RepID=UPI001591B021|nr:endonuclease/exonuclease/phosphatase family protein [Streptomyces sp. NA02950]QKV96460.1 endonuclease/exonuclease/phosphatase family protein [Streptomyces sp. NA02950]